MNETDSVVEEFDFEPERVETDDECPACAGLGVVSNSDGALVYCRRCDGTGTVC
jgi:DnaJ-class molecular chaperone